MHLPSPGHQVMPLYLIETVKRDWLYLLPLETVTEEGEPETVTVEGEPARDERHIQMYYYQDALGV